MPATPLCAIATPSGRLNHTFEMPGNTCRVSIASSIFAAFLLDSIFNKANAKLATTNTVNTASASSVKLRKPCVAIIPLAQPGRSGCAAA